MIGDSVHGANLLDIVYGGELPETGDPSEDFIEASKLHRESMGWEAPGVRMLENTPEMHPVISRAGRDYASRPSIDLPPAAELSMSVPEALRRRHSAQHFDTAQMSLQDLSTLLRHVWEPLAGSGPSHGTQPRRASPSAGALQPLDLWVVVRDVQSLAPGLYYVSMNTSGEANLVFIRDVAPGDFSRASLQEDMTAQAPVSVVITAMPWRSRFKYGHRAVRFALIEAGHACQNLLLTATAMGMASRPLGGFCDDEVNSALGFDGVDEFALYVVPLSAPTER